MDRVRDRLCQEKLCVLTCTHIYAEWELVKSPSLAPLWIAGTAQPRETVLTLVRISVRIWSVAWLCSYSEPDTHLVVFPPVSNAGEE